MKYALISILLLFSDFGFLYAQKKSDLKNFTILKSNFTPDNKHRLEFLKHNFYDERCTENLPVSLNRDIGICQLRLYDNIENKMILQIIAGDEKKKNFKKCPNHQFPLALAYGFQAITNNSIQFFTELGWFGVDDRNLTYSEFNWQTCETKKLWKYSQLHCPSYCDFTTFLSIENEIYVFYFNRISNTIDGEKTIETDPNLSENQLFELFFNEGSDFPILKKNVSKSVLKIPLQKYDDPESLSIGTYPKYPNINIYINDRLYLFNFKHQILIRMK